MPTIIRRDSRLTGAGPLCQSGGGTRYYVGCLGRIVALDATAAAAVLDASSLYDVPVQVTGIGIGLGGIAALAGDVVYAHSSSSGLPVLGSLAISTTEKWLATDLTNVYVGAAKGEVVKITGSTPAVSWRRKVMDRVALAVWAGSYLYCFNGTGRGMILDASGNAVAAFTATGVVDPVGAVVDANGRLAVACRARDQVIRFSLTSPTAPTVYSTTQERGGLRGVAANGRVATDAGQTDCVYPQLGAFYDSSAARNVWTSPVGVLYGPAAVGAVPTIQSLTVPTYFDASFNAVTTWSGSALERVVVTAPDGTVTAYGPASASPATHTVPRSGWGTYRVAAFLTDDEGRTDWLTALTQSIGRRWQMGEGAGSTFSEDTGGISLSVTSGSTEWDANGFRWRASKYGVTDVSSLTDLPAGNNPLWMSCSVRFAYVGAAPVQGQVVGYGRQGGGAKSFLGLFRAGSGSQMAWFIAGPPGGSGVFGGVTLAADTWYHFIIQYSAGVVTLYANGVQAGSPVSVGACDFAREKLILGEDAPPQTDTLDGYIRNVACGGAVLSASEITALYTRDRIT